MKPRKPIRERRWMVVYDGLKLGKVAQYEKYEAQNSVVECFSGKGRVIEVEIREVVKRKAVRK